MGSLPGRIGKFEVLSLIGRGAMGVVYKARDPYIGRLVALKRVSLGDLLPDEQKAEFKARFFVEAQAAGGLKHPNIVVIHEVGEADGVPYMAMEFVEGGSLATLMRERGALPLEEAEAIVRQVALGLAYAHERGIVHRDIKPDNILLDKNHRAVITDFGAAHLNTSELTRTGEVLGTPHYMSPEQILGDPLDGRSDLFSLGVVFYLLLTGHRPFRGDTVSSVCYHIVHSQPEPVPEDLRVPSPLLPILQKLLAKSRDGRFQTGLDLVAALNEVQLLPPPGPPVSGSLTQTWDVPSPPPPEADGPPPVQEVSERERPAPESRPGRSGPGKGLWIALGLGAAGFAALLLMAAIVVAVHFLSGKDQRDQPSPAASPQTGAVSPEPSGTAPEVPLGEPKWPPVPKTPGRMPRAQVPGLPPRTSPPQASPRVAAEADAIVAASQEVGVLAARRRFGKAYGTLDDLHRRFDALKASAAPADAPAIGRAGERLADAENKAQQALAESSKPLLDHASSVLEQATSHVNTDEDAIIAAYAAVYPVIRWKDRLPSALQSQVEEFVRQCRDNLNDDEWARAQESGQRTAFPGQD